MGKKKKEQENQTYAKKPPPIKLVGLRRDPRAHIFAGATFADKSFKTMCGAKRPASEARPLRYTITGSVAPDGMPKKRRLCVECFEAYQIVGAVT